MCILAWKNWRNRCANEHFPVQTLFHITHSFIICLNPCRYGWIEMLSLKRTVRQEIQFDKGKAQILKFVQKIIHAQLSTWMCHIQRKSPIQRRQRFTLGIFEDNIAIRILIVGTLYRLAHIVAPIYKWCPIDTCMLTITLNY
ncbi:hypothetical protein D3C78_948820 [compost metagenome]